MYGINAISFLRKSLFTKIKTTVVSLKCVQRNSFKAKHSTLYDLTSQVKNDVVLFSFENPKYFLILNAFSASHCVIWTYLGLFFFRTFKNSPLDIKSDNFWGKIIETERKYSKTLGVLAVFFGWLVLFASCLYSLKSVRKIILHKGGRSITLVTYNLPGYNKIEIPLSNISARECRKKAKKFIPVKIKNTLFYYLIDVKGNFSNPALFDFTVGVKRGL